MTDDKFIMFGLDDSRSKDIAEVIGNKTCKKIIDYLAETKEASEKDISDALSIPLNTTEYNLNKLVKVGLVEKTKNFFWSIKGKKIEMYKLAKKHIVISPKSKPNMEKLKSVIPVIIIGAILLIAALIAINYYNVPNNSNNFNVSDKPMQFNSFEELKGFLKDNLQQKQGYDLYSEGAINTLTKSATAPTSAGSSSGQARDSLESASSSEYSTTNIQVKGVDEADIVKNDGKYIYTISGNNVLIINAYPADKMEILSSINLTSPRNIFINKNKLIVFEDSYKSYESEESVSGVADVSINQKEAIMCRGYGCGGYSESITKVYIYDISDRKNPVLSKNLTFEGSYSESRMIDNYIYLISNQYVYNYEPIIPYYEVNGVRSSIPIDSFYYFDYPDTNYVFNTIGSIDLENGNVNTKVYLMPGSGQIYVSLNNIYLTYTKTITYDDRARVFADEVAYKILPNGEKEKIENILNEKSYLDKVTLIKKVIFDYSMSLSGSEKEEFDSKYLNLSNGFNYNINKRIEKTEIHKININKGVISYDCNGEVFGHVLNQFSMDEYEGNFRIATTLGQEWDGKFENSVYVLDKKLNLIGSLEDLAKGEKIYSARFTGNRAYIVTFKTVDPLFVIELKDPTTPKVLGYLKIPGYSDYLHPYDENHVIGFGKDVNESIDADKVHSQGAVYYTAIQGLKISLFDVSDVEKPVEISKVILGERGSESLVLNDHKALLFDKEKGLLVIPVTLTKLKNESNPYNSYEYPETVFNGAYVFDINLSGIYTRGKITHVDNKEEIKYGPAKDESIGSTRVDESSNIWTKVNIVTNSYGQSYGQWVTNSSGYVGVVYQDYNIDSMIGGINYHPYFNDYMYQIQRSLFMDNVIYTISQSKIMANDLKSLDKINAIDLGYKENNYYDGIVY